MSRARDIIKEIADVRGRREPGSGMGELFCCLSQLERAFQAHDKSQSELTRYFPVALIACMESYFRAVIRELVDAGDPYLANAEKASTTIKPDFSILRAIHGRKITIGEFVSHSVSISRFEHIEGVLSSLFGTSFLMKLRLTTSFRKSEAEGKQLKPVLEKPDEVFADVSRTFDLRHVICHEIASAYEIEPAEIERCFESCVTFLRAAEVCVFQTLYPGLPLTQTEMNIAAYKSLEGAEVKLLSILSSLSQNSNAEQRARLSEVQEKWRAYCESWVDLRVGCREGGGTIWPALYSGIKRSIVEQRVLDLEKYRDLSEYET